MRLYLANLVAIFFAIRFENQNNECHKNCAVYVISRRVVGVTPEAPNKKYSTS